ncbi:MAG: hypothetical protein ACRD3T_04120 [Terriglobia bacterium]
MVTWLLLTIRQIDDFRLTIADLPLTMVDCRLTTCHWPLTIDHFRFTIDDGRLQILIQQSKIDSRQSFVSQRHHRVNLRGPTGDGCPKQSWLTFFRTGSMVFHMKTTLVIPDPVFRDLKRRAAERGETMSSLVTEYLRQGLRETRKPKRPFTFPTFSAGPPLIDIANRETLYEVLEAERDERLYGRPRKKG